MHHYPPMTRLAELMANRNITDHKVAGELDVNPSTVWRWRVGRTGIPDSQKLALADLFDVPVPYLMGWDDRYDRDDLERAA